LCGCRKTIGRWPALSEEEEDRADAADQAEVVEGRADVDEERPESGAEISREERAEEGAEGLPAVVFVSSGGASMAFSFSSPSSAG